MRWRIELPKPTEKATPATSEGSDAVAALPADGTPETTDEDGPTMAGVTVADVDRDGALDILLA